MASARQTSTGGISLRPFGCVHVCYWSRRKSPSDRCSGQQASRSAHRRLLWKFRTTIPSSFYSSARCVYRHQKLTRLHYLSSSAIARCWLLMQSVILGHLLDLADQEASMCARYWTSGWDIFAPTQAIVFHLWDRSYRPSFREVPNQSKSRKC